MNMKKYLLKGYKFYILLLLSVLLFFTASGCFNGGRGFTNPKSDEYKRKELEWENEKKEKAAREKEKLYEAGPPEEIFTNTNVYSVQNGGDSPSFSILETTKIAMIKTYHWNDAKGKAPGTIGLKDKNGKSYGPWKASSEPGQGGVKNAYWKVTPNIELPGGIYTILDSDPSTWAQNKESKGEGMAWVFAATKKED